MNLYIPLNKVTEQNLLNWLKNVVVIDNTKSVVFVSMCILELFFKE